MESQVQQESFQPISIQDRSIVQEELMPYSRLKKNAQKKMMIQSVSFIGLAGVVLAVFLFFILPQTMRVYDAFSKKTNPFVEKDTVPPQKPVVDSLYEATNSAEIAIKGYGEADTTIILQDNGTEVSRTTAANDGSFLFPSFRLMDGTNEIVIVSKDKAENTSASLSQTVLFDQTAPTITVNEPTDGQTVTKRREQTISIKGVSEPNTQVFLNDKFMMIDAQGNFSGQYTLQEGDNLLHFSAIDKAGNKAELELHVTFAP